MLRVPLKMVKVRMGMVDTNKKNKEMKKKCITVLDYETGRVYQYQVSINKHAEEYITFKGHRLSNIEWMEHNDSRLITN